MQSCIRGLLVLVIYNIVGRQHRQILYEMASEYYICWEASRKVQMEADFDPLERIEGVLLA